MVSSSHLVTRRFRLVCRRLQMSFLSEIQGFSKTRLKRAETEVTTVGGRRVRESRDEDGNVTSEVRGKRFLFPTNSGAETQVGQCCHLCI